MNALIKKEIRLLLPSWIAAVLLAMIQAITRPYDFYVAWLLFFGMTIMALTTIGREASLNTFSSLLLAQPAERIKIWKTKLLVLAVGFATVFIVWLMAFAIAFFHSTVTPSDAADSCNLFIAACLIATATFTGGLWTTLLLRQIAGAFWITLLVPATLSGISGIFLAESESSNLVIAVLSVVIGVYSLAGFLFARWLFFRAQDIGWSGGVIAMPEWRFLSARAEQAGSARHRKPIYALFKKELQLHQGSLLGAVGLVVLHTGVVVFRGVHHFAPDSVGAALSAIFWMLWLVMAPLIGSMAVAEERRTGVADGQLCLPVSRRIQFIVKALLTLCLAVFLGGVMPLLIERLGIHFGSPSIFGAPAGSAQMHSPANLFPPLQWGILAFTAWLALVSFFASTLAKSFLQAIGIGVATFFCCTILVPVFANGRMLFLDNLNASCILPLVIAVPTITITLLGLAYLNFSHFLGDWRLWRRNILGVLGAVLFVFASSNALYHRAWEIFEPAEPAHGPAKLSQANPPGMENESYQNLVVRLPDGRVWFDSLSETLWPGSDFHWQLFWKMLNPLPHSVGPAKYFPSDGWISATARRVDEQVEVAQTNSGPRETVHFRGYADTVAVKADGTLWVSDEHDPNIWSGKLTQFGFETNWQAVVRSYRISSVLLLKKNGTLWLWGTNRVDFRTWPQNWPGLRSFEPVQVGTDSDWRAIYSLGSFLACKADGSAWWIYDREHPRRAANCDAIAGQKFSGRSLNAGAFVRRDGTLWIFGDLRETNRQAEFAIMQSGTETNWVAAARSWEWMLAIKKDGTLWQWPFRPVWRNYRDALAEALTSPPQRLGIHSDWISVVPVEGGAVTLAADGSLWFWPNPQYYGYSQLLMQLPKQPQFIGNVFVSTSN